MSLIKKRNKETKDQEKTTMRSGISGNQIAPTSGEELTKGGQEAMASSDIFTISAINVNSLNLSTYRKNKDCRTKIKLRAITERNYDIILMSECRMGKKGVGIVKKELDGLGYQLCSQSKQSRRGVAIAIKKNPEISILEEIADKEDENYLLLKCKIKGREMLLGVVYGPGEKDFYEKLKDLVKSFNLPTILGGDFNTVLDGTAPDQGNLDLPGRILHEWLNEGEFCDPYREKYSDGTDMSYLGFRLRRRRDEDEEDKDEEDEDEDEDEDEEVEDVEDEDNDDKDKDGKSRRDFFIISRSLLKNVMSVVYDQRLSDIVDHKPGKIFDHVEVILSLGMDEHLNRSSGITDPKEAIEEATAGCCKCLAECVISQHRRDEKSKQSGNSQEQQNENKELYENAGYSEGGKKNSKVLYNKTKESNEKAGNSGVEEKGIKEPDEKAEKSRRGKKETKELDKKSGHKKGGEKKSKASDEKSQQITGGKMKSKKWDNKSEHRERGEEKSTALEEKSGQSTGTEKENKELENKFGKKGGGEKKSKASDEKSGLSRGRVKESKVLDDKSGHKGGGKEKSKASAEKGEQSKGGKKESRVFDNKSRQRGEGEKKSKALDESLKISAINVRSLNLATCSEEDENCRTLLKLNAITEGNSDVIFMSECHFGSETEEESVERLEMLKDILRKKYNYNLYPNSTRTSRGVAIAISNSLEDVEILKKYKPRKEKPQNYLLLRCIIEGKQFLLGVVYGPNKDKDDKSFYHKLINLVKLIGLPTILGGDFNTVLDNNKELSKNLDLKKLKGIPQPGNGRILRNWLNKEKFYDPYRYLHPKEKAMSRFGDHGQSRIDFFIISKDLRDAVESVIYKERIPDLFDHVEVVLTLYKQICLST